jgi:hypothetical protein
VLLQQVTVQRKQLQLLLVQDPQDLLEPLVHKVLRVLKVLLEQVLKVLKDIRVLQDQLVLRVLKVLLVAVAVDQDQLVLRVLKVLKVHQVAVAVERVSP